MLRRFRGLSPSLLAALALMTTLSAQAEDSEGSSRRHRRHHDEPSEEASSERHHRSRHEDEESSSERRSRRRHRSDEEQTPGVTAEAAPRPDGQNGASTPNGSAQAPGTTQPALPQPPPYTAEPPRPEVVKGASLVDFKKIKPEELRLLNTTVEERHEAIQSSDRCESLRLASRVPFREWMFREHSREVFVAVGLFMLSVLALVFRLAVLRVLMPLPALLGAGYLVYVGVTDTQKLQETVSFGLQACSMALPEGSASSVPVVQKRLEQVDRMMAAIDDAYGAHQDTIDSVLERYKL